MKQKYPYIFKILLAAVFTLLAFFVPILSVRLVLGFIAVIILSLNLRKFTAFFITFTVLFFLIPSLVAMFVSNVSQPAQFFEDIFGGTVQWGYNLDKRGYNYSYESNTKILRPDKEIDFSKNINIKGINYNINFDDESDKIEIPNELSYDVQNGDLKIYYEGNWNNTRADIVIGTKNNIYKNINIDSVVLDVRGKLNADELDIKSTTTKMHLDLTGEYFDINSTTTKLDGNFKVNDFKANSTTSNYNIDFVGRSIDIDSVNTDLNGTYNTNKMKIKGINVSITSSVESVENIIIDSNVSNIDIKYLDVWKGKRYIDINSKIGKAKIGKTAKNEGDLIINSDSRYNVERYTYLGF